MSDVWGHREIAGLPEYIYAKDETLNKRVVHVLKNGWAISMVTGHKFKYLKGV